MRPRLPLLTALLLAACADQDRTRPIQTVTDLDTAALLQARLAGPTARLHENNGCTGDALNIGQNQNIADLRFSGFNDEARSVTLDGPAGAYFSAFDRSQFHLTDDYTIIRKSDGQPVCIVTFRQPEIGRWVPYRGYDMWYSGGNGIDGKISSVRWGHWW
jgi:hypothetical protein